MDEGRFEEAGLAERPYRIAIRAEGAMVNAYWTRTESMDGAQLVASISRELCEAEWAMFSAFRMLMEAAAVELVRLRLGARVSAVEVTPAAEHERAGRA